MSRGHPLDELGRVLPHAWWPADRQAPGELELVRRFCNSINRENGAERFRTSAALDRWLTSEGCVPVHASRAELVRITELRESLHRLVVANAGGVDDPDAWDSLAAAAADVSFRVVRTRDAIELQPTGSAVDVLIGRLVATVLAARGDGSWARLKACRHCHWAVYDPSKNRSSRWCSMTACGGRHNAREYRRRRQSAG
ncbi:MAG TPA: CGNR zinc finger domain-containing protein [Ilumatobacter sp.]|jgi:predicted RNA-binding Zn ribbon-like protein|nr:CGNR zinc finger domain-containing protein [Ilumatobacter sp.]